MLLTFFFYELQTIDKSNTNFIYGVNVVRNVLFYLF